MPTRPQLHFTAGEGWINDPLGLTYHNEMYHLFFQYVPGMTAWAPNCRWGHATSPDLVRWVEQPVALYPGDGDDGCWSGSVVAPLDQDAVMFYTSVLVPDFDIGRVRRARPADPDWNTWIKQDWVVDAPADVSLTAFRDPFVFRDRDLWRMLIGASQADGTATAFVYTSADLVRWDYTGRLAERPGSETQPVWTGTMWECVQLIPVGDKHVLVVSVYDQAVLHYVACAVGSYDDGRFGAENWYRLTYGPAPYAASAYRDKNGEPGLIAWLRGIADPDGIWAGALSVPSLLSVDEQGRPVLSPHPNLAGPRQKAAPGITCAEPQIAQWSTGAAVAVEWSPQADIGETLQLSGPDNVVVAEIRIADQSLTLTAPVADSDSTCVMPGPGGGGIQLLLDGPVLEVFCGGALMAAAINPHHQQLRAFNDEGTGSYRYWMLAPR
jgi:beta-fructofuranosidase